MSEGKRNEQSESTLKRHLKEKKKPGHTKEAAAVDSSSEEEVVSSESPSIKAKLIFLTIY